MVCWDDDIAIGIVARLVPVKNHSMLLRAAAPLLKDGSVPAKVVIVGDGSERAALESLSAELGISGRVIFLGERRDTEKLLNAMDVYVLSSISEGMNLTLLEAMSAALPVVATDVGGNGELVENGISGHLVNLGDIDAMTNRLREFALSPRLRREMGAAGRESIIRRFDERVMIGHYLKLYGGAAN